MTGVLYLVSISIGNDEDISLRALRILREVDLIVCEEWKYAKKFLKTCSIEKPLEILNEHLEEEKSIEILHLLKEGKNIALISDHGTPLIEDPGFSLVKLAIQQNIKITTIPGASSILSGLILSGFSTKRFLYYGLLSAKKEERKRELLNLKNYPYTIIFLDTPYRLISLLEAIRDVFGENRQACLSANLTMASEKIFRGSIKNILNLIKKESNKKFEFVLVVEGKKNDHYKNFV
jgi:16S rRNA (cytidine1402-2'-O)-methyltransferase